MKGPKRFFLACLLASLPLNTSSAADRTATIIPDFPATPVGFMIKSLLKVELALRQTTRPNDLDRLADSLFMALDTFSEEISTLPVWEANLGRIKQFAQSLKHQAKAKASQDDFPVTRQSSLLRCRQLTQETINTYYSGLYEFVTQNEIEHHEKIYELFSFLEENYQTFVRQIMDGFEATLQGEVSTDLFELDTMLILWGKLLARATLPPDPRDPYIILLRTVETDVIGQAQMIRARSQALIDLLSQEQEVPVSCTIPSERIPSCSDFLGWDPRSVCMN